MKRWWLSSKCFFGALDWLWKVEKWNLKPHGVVGWRLQVVSGLWMGLIIIHDLRLLNEDYAKWKFNTPSHHSNLLMIVIQRWFRLKVILSKGSVQKRQLTCQSDSSVWKVKTVRNLYILIELLTKLQTKRS